MKMADLMDTDFAVLGVFTRMGLSLGYGEASVEEVCRKAGVSPETFLLICRVYAQDGYRPTREALSKASIRDIVNYLRRSHTYYMEVVLQKLADSLTAMVRSCEPRSRDIMGRFFRDYREELSRHFEYEETHVFPYVETGGSAAFKVAEFEQTHESAEEKLEDLKSLVLKYLPEGSDPGEAERTVQLLYILSRDVRKHIILEDYVLAPLLDKRERHELEASLDLAPREDDSLSVREKEILVCVARGLLNKEIADVCNLSIHTVITHRKNITRKTGIKTVAGLTVYALLNNLIDMNAVE